MVPKDNELGKLYKFEELYDLGLRPGDIVAYNFCITDNGPVWDYVLLRDGFPESFNAALCCSPHPLHPDKGYILSQLGFHWCGIKPSRFRLTSNEERKAFIEGCIKTLKSPMDDHGWSVREYCEILSSMAKWKLLNYYEVIKLNKELLKLHKVDLLKEYNNIFGDRPSKLFE